MTIQEIMNRVKAVKGDFVNGLLTSDEMVEHLEDLIHDTEGSDAYGGFGTTMEDDGFYDDLPDFTQLKV